MGLFPAATTVNNELMALSDRLIVNGHVDLIFPDSVMGGEIYRRSLVLLLNLAWFKIDKELQLKIEHSSGNAYYFSVVKNDNFVNVQE